MTCTILRAIQQEQEEERAGTGEPLGTTVGIIRDTAQASNRSSTPGCWRNNPRPTAEERGAVTVDSEPNNSSKPSQANMALDFAATYKVLVLGDSNVGKTCIVHRYCDERYYDTYISTIGIDFKQKIINLDGTPIKLQIWDTAGQERFRTLTTAYYRGAMGILLMYDVTSLESFNHLSYWLRNIQENASPDVVKVLAANKCDATSHRAVDAERGQKIAENFDMPFFEVSCKENINIEEAFLTLARRIREQRGRRASLFEASEREGADSVIKAQSPSQQEDAWRCSC